MKVLSVMESFAQLFEESLARQEMRQGEVITAEVVLIDHNFVVVNAGLKSESYVPLEEFLNDQGELEVKEGDFVQVAIEMLEDGYGATRLSRDRAKRIAAWNFLEEALNNYSGTVLYVSHDRYFINQTCSRILELVNQTFVNYIGNYDYYLEKKEELTTAYAGAASTSSSVSDNSTDKNVSESKLSWQEQKEAQARLRKRQNELKKTEERIGELEDRDSEIDALMIQEDIFTNSVKCQELAKEKAAIAEELEELYMKWEELAEDA